MELDRVSILMESFRRTDSYIIAADQKASFTLAAGVTFLGIFCSVFYSIISNDKIDLPNQLIIAIVASSVSVWVFWFYKIRCVFWPKVAASERKSVVSFASATATHNDFSHYLETYLKSMDKEPSHNDLTKLELDILENHWICANICSQKMALFKESLTWLFVSLAVSTIGLAYVAVYLNVISLVV
ncbi:hypothetical protein HJ144_02385 [Vibrio parahaemolyticus]|uniref:hypothetical protein n=1 Tax=Vibrio parahaemolyticus TaxID=670 RepID=UPI00186A604A|nr:hypothetical protein [Vibrio parahaemolyticus]MBE3950673.1 hypothetical protein [Vibrio parahaemolyticus]MBE4423391.1 hypothetical protein [Vibrio parahaemolyticus]MEA5227087.1 hypothetical protein [Vibrio parahaemolyticus]HBC3838303.1 hypothetical protein [Vibrio parahaemolyticus]HCG7437012.1 hypothetical protein [Vibrio parahaemolyticus]